MGEQAGAPALRLPCIEERDICTNKEKEATNLREKVGYTREAEGRKESGK